YAATLLGRSPQVVRLNGNEFRALAGAAPERDAIAKFASGQHFVVGLTGASDFVTDGTRLVAIGHGHQLMTRITALGCAESALVAGCLAVERDAWQATAAALLIMGIAGEIAAQRAQGPGSFGVEILDALYALDRDTIVARAKVT